MNSITLDPACTIKNYIKQTAHWQIKKSNSIEFDQLPILHALLAIHAGMAMGHCPSQKVCARSTCSSIVGTRPANKFRCMCGVYAVDQTHTPTSIKTFVPNFASLIL